MAGMGGYLRSGIVLALSLDAEWAVPAPLVLAETKDPAGLRRALETRSAQTAGKNPLPPMQILTDRAALTQAVAQEVASLAAETAQGRPPIRPHPPRPLRHPPAKTRPPWCGSPTTG